MVSDDFQKRLDDLFTFKSDKERVQFEAEILSLDIMYEIECLMKKEDGLNKTELANKLGVSKGYLTQLFTADKLINLKTIAKLQSIFNIKFNVTYESIKKLKSKAMEKKFKKQVFPVEYNNWHHKIKISGTTYEIREIPNEPERFTDSKNAEENKFQSVA